MKIFAVDPATKEGDLTVGVLFKVNDDGTRTVLSTHRPQQKDVSIRMVSKDGIWGIHKSIWNLSI